MRSRNLTWIALLISVTFAITAPIFAQDHSAGGQTGPLKTLTGEFLDHGSPIQIAVQVTRDCAQATNSDSISSRSG